MGAWLDVFNVLLEPTAVFERLRERARWLEPVVVVLGLYLIILALMWPFTRVVAQAAMQEAMQQRGLSPDQMPSAVGPVMIALGLVSGAIIFCIILLLGAGLLWISASLYGTDAKFSTLFSITAHTSILFILQQVVILAVLMVRGAESITGPADLQPPLGLDLLAPGTTGFVGGLLKGVNPFSVVGYWLTGIGVAVTHRTSKGTGQAIAFSAFAVMLLLGAALSMLQPGAR